MDVFTKSVHPAQLRAARAALGLSSRELGSLAGVGAAEVERFEALDELPSGTPPAVAVKLSGALEGMGLRFVQGEGGEVGVIAGPRALAASQAAGTVALMDRMRARRNIDRDPDFDLDFEDLGDDLGEDLGDDDLAMLAEDPDGDPFADSRAITAPEPGGGAGTGLAVPDRPIGGFGGGGMLALMGAVMLAVPVMLYSMVNDAQHRKDKEAVAAAAPTLQPAAASAAAPAAPPAALPPTATAPVIAKAEAAKTVSEPKRSAFEAHQAELQAADEAALRAFLRDALPEDAVRIPTGHRKLEVWRIGERFYARTPFTLVDPAPKRTVSTARGTNVYVLGDRQPMIAMFDINGERAIVAVGERPGLTVGQGDDSHLLSLARTEKPVTPPVPAVHQPVTAMVAPPSPFPPSVAAPSVTPPMARTSPEVVPQRPMPRPADPVPAAPRGTVSEVGKAAGPAAMCDTLTRKVAALQPQLIAEANLAVRDEIARLMTSLVDSAKGVGCDGNAVIARSLSDLDVDRAVADIRARLTVPPPAAASAP